jgi:preprotein translocase subunit SecA
MLRKFGTMTTASNSSSRPALDNPALQPNELAIAGEATGELALAGVKELGDIDPTDPVSETTGSAAGTNNIPASRVSGNVRFGLAGFSFRMARWRKMLRQINDFEPTLMGEDDTNLRKRSLALRYRAMAGEKLGTILPEAYALAREAGRRALSMRHYDVQMIGGISLFEGCIAEMQTGEGKTLTATLPLYLHSLGRQGCALSDGQRLLGKTRCRVDATSVRHAGNIGGRHPNA